MGREHVRPTNLEYFYGKRKDEYESFFGNGKSLMTQRNVVGVG